MDSKIHITSLEVLDRLRSALGEFSGDVSEKIQNISEMVERQMDWLDDSCRSLQADVDYWQDALDCADDEEDDIDYFACKRDAAFEKLQEAKEKQKRASDAADNYFRCARRMNVIANERIDESRHFLNQKIKELDDYIALDLDNGNFSTTSPNSAFIDFASDREEPELERRQAAAKMDWEQAKGRHKSRFGLEAGKFAHERYRDKIHAWETQAGRKRRVDQSDSGDFGLDFALRHPDGNMVFYDYVDFVFDTIIDYKSAKEGQTEKDVAEVRKNANQRKRHVEAYEHHFGKKPVYRYETYVSSVNLFSKEEIS